ncbi:hypothetical protein ACULNC_02435 [Shigella flexneri]
MEPSDSVQTFSRRNGGEATSIFEVPKNETKENGIRLSERKETLGDVTHRNSDSADCAGPGGDVLPVARETTGTWIVLLDKTDDGRQPLQCGQPLLGLCAEANLVGRATAIWMSFDKQEGEWPTGVRLSRIGGIH